MTQTNRKKKSASAPKGLVQTDLWSLMATTSPAAEPLGATQPAPEKAEATQEGRAITLRYYERKRIILTREKSNYTEIIFTKAPSGTWYKAFGKSAVYFTQKYARLIGSKASLKVDRDFQFRDKVGVVSIPNMDLLIEGLKKQKVELIDTENEIYTFKLPERITADEYNLMKERCETIFERANTMIRPQIMMPNLFEDAKDAFVTVFWTFRDMHEWVRRIVGSDFTKELEQIVVEYTIIAKTKDGDVEAFLTKAMERVIRTEGYFMALSPLRVVNDEKLFEIAGKLSKLKRQIIFERKKIATKRIDEENRGRIA